MAYVPLTNLQARALPAAGAYYTGSTAAEIQGEALRENHEGSPTINFRVTYTAGASGGYPAMKVVWTVLNASGSEVTMIDTISVASASSGVCTTYAATNA